jgi:hypothetical protein
MNVVMKSQEHIRPEIQAMFEQDGEITQRQLDEWFKDRGMNSYERELLYPKYSDEALCRVAQSCIDNMSNHRSPASTYEESMCTVIGPLLLKRLMDKL